jgi:hypothetical protein
MQPLREGTYGMVVNAQVAGHTGCKLGAKVAHLTVEMTTAEDLRRLVEEGILSRKMLDPDSTFGGHCLWVILKKAGSSLQLVTIHERAWCITGVHPSCCSPLLYPAMQQACIGCCSAYGSCTCNSTSTSDGHLVATEVPAAPAPPLPSFGHLVANKHTMCFSIADVVMAQFVVVRQYLRTILQSIVINTANTQLRL